MRELALAGICASSIVASVACSLLIKNDQCDTTDDCLAKGGDFANTSCNAGFCVTTTGGAQDGGEDSPNAVETGVTDGAGTDTGTPECSINRDCVATHGSSYFCRKSDFKCINLAGGDCTLVGDYSAADDNTVFLGALEGAGYPDVDIDLGLQLAARDFVPGGGLPTHSRPWPIFYIKCAGTNTVASVRHLIDDVQVPLLFSTMGNADSLAIANLAIAANTMLIATSAGTPQFTTTLVDHNLVYRTALSDTQHGYGLGAIMASMKADVSAASSGNRFRVVLSYSNDDYGNSIKLAADGALINSAGSSNYTATQYTPGANAQVIANAIVALQPSLVAIAGGSEGGSIVDAIENSWPTGSSAPTRPFYVVTDRVYDAPLLAALNATADLTGRVRGTMPNRMEGSPNTIPQVGDFRTKFVGLNIGKDIETGARNAYDAFYLAAYTIVGAESLPPLNGHNLSRRIWLLFSGSSQSYVGPSSISSVTQVLFSNNAGVKLLGISGPLQYQDGVDPSTKGDDTVATGDVKNEVDTWCIAQSGASFTRRFAGQYYGTDAVLTGSYSPCQ